MTEKAPGLINEESFERSSCVRVIDRRIRPMQDVEQQRLNQFGVAVHAFKVEALEARERERVLLVVEDLLVLAATNPLFQLIGGRFLQRVRKNAQRAQIRRKLIQVLNLRVQVFFFSLSQRIETATFRQDSDQRK